MYTLTRANVVSEGGLELFPEGQHLDTSRGIEDRSERGICPLTSPELHPDTSRDMGGSIKFGIKTAASWRSLPTR
jgi:hypothetical protein